MTAGVVLEPIVIKIKPKANWGTPSKNANQISFVDIAKFSSKGAKMLKKYLEEEKKNKKDYYTIVFNKMVANGQAINYYDCKDYFWKEIDTITDFNDMKKIIKNNKFKY